MKQPVSVVIPHRQDRAWFFNSFGLPSVKANNVEEIIVIDREGGAAEKRNEGAAKATQPFLLFVDDDCLLEPTMVQKLLHGLAQNPDCGYAYGNYQRVVGPGSSPHTQPHSVQGQTFDLETIRQGNYITISALMRRELFPGFDESLQKAEDWDLWLTMLKRGVKGLYVPTLSHLSFVIDKGMSDSVPHGPAMKILAQKHGLRNV